MSLLHVECFQLFLELFNIVHGLSIDCSMIHETIHLNRLVFQIDRLIRFDRF